MVRETITGQNDLKDFPYFNPDGQAASFYYDRNGNLTRDIARNISLTYNHWLDLPASIQFLNGRIAYTYGRNGVKTAKQVYNQYNQVTLDEQYFDDLVTNRGIPKRIEHGDGYIELRSDMTPKFYYYLKDHLGNVRLTLTPNSDNTPAFTQANDYYPFGMSYSKPLPIQGGNESPNGYTNKYLYNSKEEQEMPGKWLDYGARFYDPQLGRWHNLDALAEISRKWSPYSYCLNNPIRFIDPDGNDWWDVVNGSVRGVTDNLLGTNTRASYTPTDASDYNIALNHADAASLVFGVVATEIGTDAAIGGIVAAPATAGASIAIAATGAAVAAEGIVYGN